MKTVRLERIPDGYRGDLSCLRVVSSHKKEIVETSGSRLGPHDSFNIIISGEVAGKLDHYYGNGGNGKPAADEFTPAPGWIAEFTEDFI